MPQVWSTPKCERKIFFPSLQIYLGLPKEVEEGRFRWHESAIKTALRLGHSAQVRVKVSKQVRARYGKSLLTETISGRNLELKDWSLLSEDQSNLMNLSRIVFSAVLAQHLHFDFPDLKLGLEYFNTRGKVPKNFKNFQRLWAVLYLKEKHGARLAIQLGHLQPHEYHYIFNHLGGYVSPRDLGPQAELGDQGFALAQELFFSDKEDWFLR